MKKYNLLIPLAGKGQRFVDQGYNLPKFLLTAKDKTSIEWTLSSIDISECNLIFCLRGDHINNFGIDEILYKKYGKGIKIIKVNEITAGSVSTCLLAEEYIDNDLPLYIYTVDVYFEKKFIPTLLSCSGNVLTFKSNNPAYSYVRIDKNGYADLTAEKDVISNNACVGLYGFAKGSLFVKYAKKMIELNLRTKNEFYITPIYNLMIEDGHKITIEEVQKMYVFGTPEEYDFFVSRILKRFGDAPIVLVSDHSGFKIKEKTKKILDKKNIKYIDVGCFIEKNCDQFDYVSHAIKFIKNGTSNHGIGFCCTGQAINTAANKTKDIRSALIYNNYSAEYAITHNCSNFFAIPSKFTTETDIENYIDIWLNASFEGGRHSNRIQKIENSYGIL
jgi:RpiB/LacA/LacB family sugar-phosphate isomerase